MFKKILLGTDLSADSDALVICIGEMKKVGAEEIVLSYVIHSTRLDQRIEEDVRNDLARQAASLESKGFQVTVETPTGSPAPTLASAAEAHDVSLVVVGSHGRGILGEAVHGSVSTKLLHLTRRPVLVFPIQLLEDEKRMVCRSLFDNILLPTDFSETAERTIPYAAEIAVRTKSPITLLHVLDEKSDLTDQEEEGKRFLLEAKRQRLQRQGAFDVALDLRHGSPGHEICRKGAENYFSLVLMGSTKRGVVKEIVLGSTTREVIHHGGVPVMVIPPAAQ